MDNPIRRRRPDEPAAFKHAPDRFDDLYVATGRLRREGAVFSAKSEILALELADGFDIMAPWGERQTGVKGFLILSGREVYGNNAETFRKTYKQVS